MDPMNHFNWLGRSSLPLKLLPAERLQVLWRKTEKRLRPVVYSQHRRQQLKNGVKPRRKPGRTLLQVGTVSPQRPQLGLTGHGSDQRCPALSPPLATVPLGLRRAKGLSSLPQGPPVQTCPLRGQNQRKECMLQCKINVLPTKKRGASFSPFFCA